MDLTSLTIEWLSCGGFVAKCCTHEVIETEKFLVHSPSYVPISRNTAVDVLITS